MRRPRSIAGFPPPGPVTPATCIASRPQVYRAPSDLKVQQLHGLNTMRYHNGVARGVPMACPGTKLLGCAFDIKDIRSGSVAYHSTSDIPWTTARANRANAGFAGRRARRPRRRSAASRRKKGFAGMRCPQNVNDMRFSCQGFMGSMMTPPSHDEGVELLLPRLLAGMRAVYATLQTAHWQAGGEGYYGKHEMLQKIYEEVEEGYDALAERVVLYLGAWAVDPVQQNAWIGECLQRWAGIECPIERSFAAALDLRERLEMTHAVLQARGELSLGLENYLGEIAAGHDQHLYLLQRAAMSVPRGHYVEGPYMHQGGPMGAPSFPAPPTICEERCAGVPQGQWLECLAKCGGGSGSVSSHPGTPRALPAPKRMHWASPSVNRPVATSQQGQIATNLAPTRGGMRRVWRQS